MNASRNSKKRFRSNLIAFILIFGIFYAYVFLTNSGTKCFFKSVTGIPCPSCGMTRSFLHVFHGEWGQAFYDHPLFITIPFIIGAIVLSYFFYEHKTIRRGTNIFLIMMVILFIGVYIYRMFLYFPDTDPLKFYDRGLAPRMYRLGQDLFFH